MVYDRHDCCHHLPWYEGA